MVFGIVSSSARGGSLSKGCHFVREYCMKSCKAPGAGLFEPWDGRLGTGIQGSIETQVRLKLRRRVQPAPISLMQPQCVLVHAAACALAVKWPVRASRSAELHTRNTTGSLPRRLQPALVVHVSVASATPEAAPLNICAPHHENFFLYNPYHWVG